MTTDLEEVLNKDCVYHLPLEVDDDSSIGVAAETVSQIVGKEGLNLLINNAAIMTHGKGIRGCSKSELMRSYDVNVASILSLTNVMYPLLKTSAENLSKYPISFARAGIINISSSLGSITETTSNSSTPAYRISKAALNMLTRCQSLEFVKDGVLTVSVHPGWVRTDMGGPNARLSVDAAAEDIVKIIQTAGRSHNGKFIRRELEELSF